MTVRRFEDDINGTSDANGKINLVWKGMTGQFASLLLIAQAKGGSPSWTVKVTGAPVNVGRGLNSPLRLPLLQPGDGVILVGSGIQPSTAVTGHLVGYAADSPDELPLAPPEPSTISLDVAAPPQNLALVTQTGAGSSAKTVVIPPGTLGISVLIDNAAALNVAATSLVGATSAVDYSRFGAGFLASTPAFNTSQNLYHFLVDSSVDTSLTLTLASTGGAIRAWITALFDPDTVFVASDQLVNVSQALAAPAPWQGPKSRAVFSASIANGGTATLIAGVGGQIISLHSFTISADGANAAGVMKLQDTTPTDVDVYYMNATRTVYAVGDLKGLPLGSGLGVQAMNGGANAEFFGIGLRYTQQ